jgi:hypothetical protein
LALDLSHSLLNYFSSISFSELPLSSTDCPWLGAEFIAGGRPLCVGRNASYVYEIYYCSIGAGSQKVCRNIVNTLLQILDFKE